MEIGWLIQEDQKIVFLDKITLTKYDFRLIRVKATTKMNLSVIQYIYQSMENRLNFISEINLIM